jgi:hypothetical protein
LQPDELADYNRDFCALNCNGNFPTFRLAKRF